VHLRRRSDFRRRDLDGEASQFPCPQEDTCEHGAVEAAGVGVAQGWVVAGEKVKAVGQGVLGSMGEAVGGFGDDHAGVLKMGHVAIEGDLAETDDDADAGEGFDFGGKVRGAVADLLWGGFVSGRGAANDGGDPGVTELEAVVVGGACGLAGEADFVQDGVHEVAGAVAGEGAAGAVGSVGAGGETEDENAGARVAKAGYGAGPVGFVLVCPAFGFTDAPAVVAEARATFTGDDGVANLMEEWGR
jgi:hypothetical protein